MSAERSATLIDMKHIRSSIPVMLLAIGALFVTSANQNVNANPPNPSGAIFATSAANGGHLSISRSPVLGSNVAITIRIDGQRAGVLMQGHTYDKYITPGRHILRASPDSGDAWQTTLNVRAGRNYFYEASYSGKLVLTPVTP
jgi:hypothetical protein